MKEIWKAVKDYENIYEISNLGRLRSKDRYIKNGNGYRISKGKINIVPTPHVRTVGQALINIESISPYI